MLGRRGAWRRLYARTVGDKNGLTVATVVGGPLRGARIAFDPAGENRYWIGNYEPETQQLLDELAASASSAWDVGAHVGFLTLLLARRCPRVLAIEPSPENARRLRANIELNDASVEVVEAAIGREPGTAWLALARESSMNETSAAERAHDDPDARGRLVRRTTLDELAKTYGPPDLVKLDIEGAELDALLGAARVLEHRPALVIEAHSVELADAVVALLTASGYAVEHQPYRADGFVPTRLVARASGGASRMR
jgi:FkbM family methyltransferase